MYGRFALSFKITNWCNLNCAHCCENSGPLQAERLLPLNKIEKYLGEFKELPYNLSEHIVIGGGEGLSPYLFGNFDYIPDLLMMINAQNGVSTIKTNCAWGNKKAKARMILQDLAKAAHKTGKVVTLDISVDEFHDNISGVTKIIAEILSNEYLMEAVRLTLVGFRTLASAAALLRLKKELTARKMLVDITRSGDFIIYNEQGQGVFVVTDYNNEIFDIGRAKKNDVFTYRQQIPGLLKVNCIQIDSNDTAILNNFYREKINNRPLRTVVDSLIHRAK